jgi:hypothetical protein
VVAARYNSFPEAVGRRAALQGARLYRERMAVYETMRHLNVWYSRVTVDDALKGARAEAGV